MNEAIRFSEAIRLGAMMKPQAHGRYYDGTGTCALGAAFDAIGQLDQLRSVEFRKAFPIISIPTVSCPQCGETFRTVQENILCNSMCTAVAHLNDEHRWTREQIADWVATIEDKHQPRMSRHPVVSSESQFESESVK